MLFLLEKAAARMGFWLTAPFVRAAFYLRERKRDRLRFPRRWLSPQQIVSLDLDLIDDDDQPRMDRSLLDLLVARRDQIKANSSRVSVVNLSLSVFLLATYFKVGADVSVLGISIKDSAGVPEFLLATNATMALYISSLQGNVSILEGAISHLIGKIFPAGMSNVMRAALLTEASIGKYYPLNMPHLLLTDFHWRLGKFLAYFMVVIALVVAIIIIGFNVALMLSIWKQSSIGIYSNLIVIYVAICGIFSFLFMFLTRLPTTFTDYSLLHQMQIAEQLNPKHAEEIRRKAYRSSIEDQSDLEQRGFIKPRSPYQRK
ncbi:hypothetical protein CK218_10805 [Mesorhizobium sp. WSM3879]|uniref:hypothetical protein n=1 Tax=Mesorhizobium sp. WSM3879 TaxID=2029406 RepID=UPI000BB0BABD|nr:hypothetical protein [Mesorhizobium sp. WSM3879]PBB80892.1 hypothetical protein CK218_10805 [Mesorhizobium sp. WSM3879]